MNQRDLRNYPTFFQFQAYFIVIVKYMINCVKKIDLNLLSVCTVCPYLLTLNKWLIYRKKLIPSDGKSTCTLFKTWTQELYGTLNIIMNNTCAPTLENP